MPEKITLYDIGPSPNNMKVRIGLNYKELSYETVAVNLEDRSELVRISGQPLTPTMIHGDRVVFDSAAILRYLEGNFRDTPRLFAEDRETMQAIEGWERLSRGGEISEPVGMIFGQFFQQEKKASEIQRASALMHERTERFEKRLAEGKWLVGDRMTAADVSTAPFVWYSMLPPEAAEANPIAKFFAGALKLGEGRDRTRAWATRVMAYDR